MAAFPVLFDANVIYGFHLTDVVLGLAEKGLFRPLWSEQILEEIYKNLVEDGFAEDKIKHRLDTMRRTFPDATVHGFENLIEQMTNNAKDRHVLAAAIRANAEILVTFDLKGFPETATANYEIEIVDPDKFLLDQLDLYPGATVTTLKQLVDDYSRPELSMEDLLVRLAEAGVPSFANAVRNHL